MSENLISIEATVKSVPFPKKKKNYITIQICGEQLSVYFMADRCLSLSFCCLPRRSGNGSGNENESGTENGSETVCSDLEQVNVNVSETWSVT